MLTVCVQCYERLTCLHVGPCGHATENTVRHTRKRMHRRSSESISDILISIELLLHASCGSFAHRSYMRRYLRRRVGLLSCPLSLDTHQVTARWTMILTQVQCSLVPEMRLVRLSE